MAAQEKEVKEAVVDHEIQDVTPEMLDWWWDNMEKGYPLWCPVDHVSFKWEVPPKENGHIGAIQIVEEAITPGQVMTIRIRWDDPKTSVVPIVYKHAMLAVGLGPNDQPVVHLLHQYEETSYGIKMRSTFHPLMPFPQAELDGWAMHNRKEVSYFPKFLPELYRLWKDIPPPANIKNSMRVRD